MISLTAVWPATIAGLDGGLSAPRRPTRSLKARSAAEDGGSRDLVVARGMTAQPSGEEDREQAIAGQGRGAQRPHRGVRSASQRPAWTRGHRQSAKESTGSDVLSGDATSPHPPALRCTSAPSRHPERTRRGRPHPCRRNQDKAHTQTEAAEGSSRRYRDDLLRSAAATHRSGKRSARQVL